jgi:hypothetical protein
LIDRTREQAATLPRAAQIIGLEGARPRRDALCGEAFSFVRGAATLPRYRIADKMPDCVFSISAILLLNFFSVIEELLSATTLDI